MGVPPESSTPAGSTRPSLQHSVLLGAASFSLVSLLVFGTVAFGQRWMYRHIGVTGAYLLWIALFIFLGGTAFSRLVVGRRLLGFCALFGAAFFAYGVSWMACYFWRSNAAGEWLGSLVGSVLMALVLAAGFGALHSAPILSLILFIGNSLGYFLGSFFFYSLSEPAGLLVWGILYGACVGAGLGAALCVAQSRAVGTPKQLT
jgi:hypothetical protein